VQSELFGLGCQEICSDRLNRQKGRASSERTVQHALEMTNAQPGQLARHAIYAATSECGPHIPKLPVK